MEQHLLERHTGQRIDDMVRCPHCRRKHRVSSDRNEYTMVVCACGTRFCVTAGHGDVKAERPKGKATKASEFQQVSYPVGHPALMSIARFTNAAKNRLKQ